MAVKQRMLSEWEKIVKCLEEEGGESTVQGRAGHLPRVRTPGGASQSIKKDGWFEMRYQNWKESKSLSDDRPEKNARCVDGVVED